MIPDGPDYSQFDIEQQDDGSWHAVGTVLTVSALPDVPGTRGRKGPLFHRREIKKFFDERGVQHRSSLMCELPHPDGGEPWRIYFRWNNVVITRQLLAP